MKLTSKYVLVTLFICAVLAMAGCTRVSNIDPIPTPKKTIALQQEKATKTSVLSASKPVTISTLNGKPRILPSRLVQSARVDLNGDGNADKIRFYCEPGGSSFVLRINNKEITGTGDYLSGYFRIVDIDSKDSFAEVTVGERTPTYEQYIEDDMTNFYAFVDDTIVFMGKANGGDIGTYGRPPEIDGSGIVKTLVNANVWAPMYPVSYRLSKDHLLDKLPNHELLDIKWRVKLKSELPIRESRTNSRIVMVLIPDEIATLLATDNERWYLLENAEGKRGWFAVENRWYVKDNRGVSVRIDKVFDRLD
jgi:hypothetical protein